MNDDNDTAMPPTKQSETPSHSVCPDCGGGWTFDFGARRVYCRTCESATSAGAVDPSASDPGKPTTRD